MKRRRKKLILTLLLLLPFTFSSCELIMDEFWNLDRIQPKIDLPSLENALR
jgi:hypothetical protein